MRAPSVILALLLALAPIFSFSRHIVGGELTYIQVGDSKYVVKLIIYRDCAGGGPGFDTPAYVGVFNSNNQYADTLNMGFPKITRVPVGSNDQCSSFNGTICYERGEYTDTVNLPGSPGGYLLSYMNCCWNYHITNIINQSSGGGSTGLTVTMKMPDSTTTPVNSSPVFNNLTPPYICLGKPFDFDHSAFDPDGDSLTYELFTPFNGDGFFTPSPPNPPPYKAVKYVNGFSLQNVLSGDPMRIDSLSGFLTAVPDVEGKFVYGVKVNEYRDGKLIGYVSRSYQINVTLCQPVTEALVESPEPLCGDSLVTFVNESKGASKYHWNFGDPGSGQSTSNVKNPQHVFSDTGIFNVMLVAIPDADPSCADTTFTMVNILPPVNPDFDYEQDKCDNLVQFTDLSTHPSDELSAWSWEFGDGGTSNNQHPAHRYDIGGFPEIFEVKLVVETKLGCKDSITTTYVGENHFLDVGIETADGRSAIYPKDDSIMLVVDPPGLSYSWIPADGVSDPTSATPYVSPDDTTTYTVTVTDNRGCSYSKRITVFVRPYTCGENDVFVPNAFTPNNDGENDLMRVRGEEMNTLYFAIYNRWGEKVYESDQVGMTQNPSMGWDGTYKGEKVQPGVYVYYLIVRCNNNEEFIKKGNITLLR